MRGRSCGIDHNLQRRRRAAFAACSVGVVALVIGALVSGGGRGAHSVRAGRLAFVAAHRTATLPSASPFDDPEPTTTTLDPTSTSTEPPTTAVPSTTTTVPPDTTTVPPTTTTVPSSTTTVRSTPTTVRSTPTTVRSTPTTVRSAPPTAPGATSTHAQPVPRSRQRLVAARVSAPTRKQPS